MLDVKDTQDPRKSTLPVELRDYTVYGGAVVREGTTLIVSQV